MISTSYSCIFMKRERFRVSSTCDIVLHTQHNQRGGEHMDVISASYS